MLMKTPTNPVTSYFLLLTICPDVVKLCLEPRQKSETFDPAEGLISFKMKGEKVCAPTTPLLIFPISLY